MCSTYSWYNVAIDIHSHHFISIIKHIELAPLWTYIQLFHQVTASPHASIDSLLIPARPLFIVLSWNLDEVTLLVRELLYIFHLSL